MKSVLAYFERLRPAKTVLWCYLIWWGVSVWFRFDSSPALWLNSVGISAVIGVGLMLSVGRPESTQPSPWQTFRLFAMPFCVSSFSSLIKGKGYVLVFPSAIDELLISIGACAVFIATVYGLKLACLKQQRPL